MIRYELVNPSDEIYFEAPSFEVALLSVTAISPMFGAKPIDPAGETVPIMAFEDFETFYFERFKRKFDIDEVHAAPTGPQIVKCLESFKTKGERTSMNDICGAAYELAERMRVTLKARGIE